MNLFPTAAPTGRGAEFYSHSGYSTDMEGFAKGNLKTDLKIDVSRASDLCLSYIFSYSKILRARRRSSLETVLWSINPDHEPPRV